MAETKDNHIVVIGAGVAGLAAALRLRAKNYHVTVLEKNATCGGKIMDFTSGGYRWDKGPSLFTNPLEVDELISLFGVNPRDYYNYQQSESTCSYYFHDKTSAHFVRDREVLKNELNSKFGIEAANRTMTYLERSGESYKRIGDFFIDNPPVKLRDVFRKELVVRYPHFLTSKLRKNLHQYNHATLKEPKLVQVFDRFGTYNGSNPFKMSGLYSMIPHLEQNIGTFFPEGGMRAIVDSLYRLAFERGVNFCFNERIIDVVKSEGGYSVRTDNAHYQASKLVCAIDHVTFYRDLLKDEKLFKHYSRQERSTSALVFYWGVKRVIPELRMHNIFFCKDYRREFDQLFTEQSFADDPTVYVHVSSVMNADDAPAGCQNWFVMINTPAGKEPDTAQILKYKNLIIDRIRQQFDSDISTSVEVENHWTSRAIEQDTGSWLGALYGASSNGKLAALRRHGNQHKKYPGLYFCGGTVHPGGGIPLVLKSAKIVANIIDKNG